MSLEERIRNRAMQILRERAETGRGIVERGPRYYQGTGIVGEGPSHYSGSGAVTAGPRYFQGAGIVGEGPSHYSGSGMVGGEQMQGEGFWNDASGFFKQVVPFYKPIVEAVGGKKGKTKKAVTKKAPATAKGEGFLDEIGKATRLMGLIGLGKKKANRAPTARAMLVKKIMKEQGCSLAEASRYIKENNLKY